MTDAVGAAEGAKREIDTATRARVEKFFNDFGVVKRDEFEVVKAMAVAAREENERLSAKIAVLEKHLGNVEKTDSSPEETGKM